MIYIDELETRILEQLHDDPHYTDDGWPPKKLARYLVPVPDLLDHEGLADEPVTMGKLHLLQAKVLDHALRRGLGAIGDQAEYVSVDKLRKIVDNNVSWPYRPIDQILHGYPELAELYGDGDLDNRLTFAILFLLRPGAFLPTHHDPR